MYVSSETTTWKAKERRRKVRARGSRRRSVPKELPAPRGEGKSEGVRGASRDDHGSIPPCSSSHGPRWTSFPFRDQRPLPKSPPTSTSTSPWILAGLSTDTASEYRPRGAPQTSLNYLTANFCERARQVDRAVASDTVEREDRLRFGSDRRFVERAVS